MIKLKKGENSVQLSLTPSFTPLITFETPFTGSIRLSKRREDGGDQKDVTINTHDDEALDLSSYREYFTAYKDSYNQLLVTVGARATLEYEPLADAPVESTAYKTLDFGLKEDPNYHPPEPEACKCPICQQEVSMNSLTAHIQSAHM